MIVLPIACVPQRNEFRDRRITGNPEVDHSENEQPATVVLRDKVLLVSTRSDLCLDPLPHPPHRLQVKHRAQSIRRLCYREEAMGSLRSGIMAGSL